MASVDKIKQQLEARLRVLGAKIDEIEGDLRTAPNPDWEDHATEIAGDEVLEGLEGSALVEASQIQAALQRIDDGTYGECATCGENIGEGRLVALPYATQCIRCVEGK